MQNIIKKLRPGSAISHDQYWVDFSERSQANKIFLSKNGNSLHAYIKSLETRMNKRITTNLSLHKAYIIPT